MPSWLLWNEKECSLIHLSTEELLRGAPAPRQFAQESGPQGENPLPDMPIIVPQWKCSKSRPNSINEIEFQVQHLRGYIMTFL